eukprot:989378_1
MPPVTDARAWTPSHCDCGESGARIYWPIGDFVAASDLCEFGSFAEFLHHNARVYVPVYYATSRYSSVYVFGEKSGHLHASSQAHSVPESLCSDQEADFRVQMLNSGNLFLRHCLLWLDREEIFGLKLDFLRLECDDFGVALLFDDF